MVSKLALLTSFRTDFYMKEYNPLAALPRFVSLRNSVTRSPGVYQEDREYTQTAGSLIQDIGILWHAHSPRSVFTYLHCSTAAAFCQSKTKASQETSEMGILSKFSSLCQSATLSFIIWLCLFPSYCLQVLRTEHQSRSQDEKKSL